jgi:Zn-dependent protease
MKQGKLLLIVAFLIGKSALFIKLFKSVKFLKILMMLLGMVFNIVVYSFALGFWFAFGFVIMLFIHEMGHVAALRLRGFPTSLPVFIPFLGALIFAPRMDDPQDEAIVGYAGPLVGGFAAIVLFWVSLNLFSQPPQILILISNVALILNLFNLIPLRPLDGGRVLRIVGLKWLPYPTFVGILALSIWSQDPSLPIIMLFLMSGMDLRPWEKAIAGVMAEATAIAIFAQMGTWRLFDAWGWFFAIVVFVVYTGFVTSFVWNAIKGKDSREISEKLGDDESTNVSSRTRLVWAGLYLGLVILLAYVWLEHRPHLPLSLR